MFYSSAFFAITTLSCFVVPALSVQSLDYQATVRGSSSTPRTPVCRCFPGDSCWPSASAWQAFNASVYGRLVATVPLASPCHNSTFAAYNANTCKALQDQWLEPQIHYEDSSSVMAPFFANRSCDPFTPEEAQCVVGSYVQYAVNVSTADHVMKTIKFAKKKNIRLVIRNTGHDYNGKSTGAGSLSVWTHHLKSLDIIDYKGPSYTGKAIKMGAGIQGFEAYAAAHDQGLRVVGGECPTVGLAGGYTQGGGHSALSSRYGLAADQTLEWEVVDGTGTYRVVNSRQNGDLFWALSGGGGSTYAIVLSMTSRAHKDGLVSAANLTFTNAGMSHDTYYKAVGAYNEVLPSLVDAGAMSVWQFTNASFAITPLTAPDVSAAKLRSLLQPYMETLDDLKINYTHVIREFPSYLDEFSAMQAPIPVGIAQYGGRLIPRSIVSNNNIALVDAYRAINDLGGIIIGVGLNVSRAVDNAVNPRWRDALISTVVTTPWNFTAPWSEMLDSQRLLTDEMLPRLAALTPDGGCYLNEGDFREPNFQSVFYGKAKYARLKQIKEKYDPDDVFYALTGVGSERWTTGVGGRLCQVG